MTTNASTTDIEAGRRWVILGVAYLCMVTFVTTLQAVPPVLSLVMAEFKLSHAQGGLLMSLYAVPGLIVSIPAGMLADRYGQRVIGLVSFSLAIAGTAIVATGNSLLVVILGRLVTGIGAMTLMVLGPQLLAEWFRGREMGMAMGIFNTGFPVGTILSLNFLAMAGESLGWRAGIWLSAMMPLAGLVIFALLFTPAPRGSQETSGQAEGFFQGIRLAGIPIWVVGAAWMLFNATIIALFTFTPDFLQTIGYSVASAGFVASAVMWTTLVMSPVVGYVIDKIDRKLAIVAIGGVATAMLVLIVPTAAGWMLALMLLIGIAQTLVPVAIFALPPEVTSPKRLGLGFGILTTCLTLGIVLGPATVGLVKDVTGSYPASYALMAGFACLIALAILILGRMRSQISAATRSG